MQVVYSPDIFLLQRTGGISRYFAEVQKELRALAVDAKIFAGVSTNEYLGQSVGQIRISGSTPATRSIYRSARGIFEGYLAAHPSSTIHHPTYFTSPPRRRRRPQVITFYDVIHARFPTELPDGERQVLARQEAWVRTADLVLAISETTAQDVVRFLGADERRVRVTPLGVRSPGAAPTDVRKNDDRVLFVGRRDGYKNWRAAARAIARPECSNITMTACGGGPPTVDELQLLDDLALTERVKFVQASDEELSRLYFASGALVYPSKYEGFGLPPLEAMARDLPVVAAAAGAIPEVVGDAALLVDPCDHAEMAAAIMEATSGIGREALVRRGRTRAAQFTWAETARRTLQAYSELTDTG